MTKVVALVFDIKQLKARCSVFQCRSEVVPVLNTCYGLNPEKTFGTDPTYPFQEKCKNRLIS